MTKVRSVLFVLAVLGPFAAGMSMTVPAYAQSGQPNPGYDTENPQELFKGATRMALKALELLIKTLPQYEPPVVLDNGDILIKRKQPSQPGSDAGPDRDRI